MLSRITIETRLGSSWAGQVTHCIHGHEFTPENTYIRPDNGWRRCKECTRIDSNRRRLAKLERFG